MAREVERLRDEAGAVHSLIHCAIRSIHQTNGIEQDLDGMRGLDVAYEARDRLDKIRGALDDLALRTSSRAEVLHG